VLSRSAEEGGREGREGWERREVREGWASGVREGEEDDAFRMGDGGEGGRGQFFSSEREGEEE